MAIASFPDGISLSGALLSGEVIQGTGAIRIGDNFKNIGGNVVNVMTMVPPFVGFNNAASQFTVLEVGSKGFASVLGVSRSRYLVSSNLVAAFAAGARVFMFRPQIQNVGTITQGGAWSIFLSQPNFHAETGDFTVASHNPLRNAATLDQTGGAVCTLLSDTTAYDEPTINTGTQIIVRRGLHFRNKVSAGTGVQATPVAVDVETQTTSSQAGTGTISNVAASTTVTGVGTAFTTQLGSSGGGGVGAGVLITSSDGQERMVVSIASDTSMTVDTAFSPNLSGATFTYGGTAMSMRSIGTAVQMRHAGPARFGTNASPANPTKTIAQFDGGLLFSRTTFNNANYTIDAAAGSGDLYLAQVGSLNGGRTVTLPSAATVGAGRIIIIKDESGSASSSVTINIALQGAETLDGASSPVNGVINLARGVVRLVSNGTNWFRW